MHRLISILLLGLLIVSCEKDGGIGHFDSLVIDSENNPYKLKQITFTLSMNNPELGYLNTTQIDSLELYVNSEYWGTFTSEYRDTCNMTDRTANNLSYSNNAINYLIVAPFQLKTDGLVTAGDFAEFLHDRIVLTPGDYVFELRKVKFQNLKGKTEEKKVQMFAPFKVTLNQTSSYVGHLQIQID